MARMALCSLPPIPVKAIFSGGERVLNFWIFVLNEFIPYSGELAAGYLGRLQNSNGVSSWKSLYALRCGNEGLLGNRVQPDGVTVVELLAEIAGMQPQDFCCAHTLLPFSRAVTGKHADRPHGENTGGRLYAKHGLSSTRDERVFCESCRIEQVRENGYSHWQRELQLPGLYLCPVHYQTLMAAPAETDFGFSPDRYADDAVPVIEIPLVRTPVVERYASIARAMLRSKHPVATREAAFKLGQRAKALGLRVGNKGQRATLEDMARETLPGLWVNRFMPGLLKEGRVYGGPLQYATVNMPNPVTAALALALMFDSAEDAWAYWLDTPAAPLPERRRNRRYQTDFWTSEKVLQMYVKHKGRLVEMAEELGIEYGHVRQCLVGAGLPSLARINFEKTGPALHAFLSGRPLEQTMTEHGVSMELTEELLRAAGARLFSALDQILKSNNQFGADGVE